ncbi:MAG: hypothetical protein WCO66_00050 [Candidatus Absconditabacteria bacterium]
MKDKAFIIKVGDLLQEAGRSDEVIFEKKWTENLPGLTEDGISGDIALQSLSKDSVFVELENINCEINSTCDTCEAEFVRSVTVEEYSGKYVLGEENIKLEQEHSEEEIFPINSRDETINIEDMMIQAIRLGDPIAIHCPTCAQKIASLPDEEDDPDYFEGNDNVIFR